jgi:hypothetical protein
MFANSGSTCHQFINLALVDRLCPADKPITIHCNAGTTSTTTMADLGSTPVYLNESGIANVLSLNELGKKHRILYDSWDRGGVFRVHSPMGVVEFAPTDKGLHALDLDADPHSATMLINMVSNPSGSPIATIRGNYKGYMKHDVAKAHAARRFQSMIGSPSPWDFDAVVRDNMIANCPITPRNIANAHAIFGRDLPSLHGKTTRRKPERVCTDYVAIPQSLIDLHVDVTLVADVMFVNGLPFLITLSRKINVVTIEYAPSRTATQLASLIQRVAQVYLRAGFRPQTIIMDMEYEKVRDKLPSLVVNTTAAREHVAEIERKIRLVKECARAIVTTLPYIRLPKIILVELLHFVVMWLNSFPVKNGISDRFSPREFLL